MTNHLERELGIAVKATEDLTIAENKMITLGGTIAQAASARKVAGLINSSTGSGYNHLAVMLGIDKALAGAAVTSAGWPIALANSGFITNAASGDYIVGRFLTTCASGDLVEVAIDTLNANFLPL